MQVNGATMVEQQRAMHEIWRMVEGHYTMEENQVQLEGTTTPEYANSTCGFQLDSSLPLHTVYFIPLEKEPGMVRSERNQERETTKTRNRLHPPKTRISQTPNRGAEEKQAC